MMNPLYNQYKSGNQPNFQQLAQRVEQLKRTFTGNPRDEVQKMLNSGRLTQAQFNQYAQMATQIARTLNIK